MNELAAKMMKNVLIVDSDLTMLRAFTVMLKSQGGFLNIFAVTNARQAIEVLHEISIHLVITAIRLPRVDGFRLVAKVTKDYPSVKVIIMTKDAHSLLRASLRRFPTAVHLDQVQDFSMFTQRVFTELQIDYGGRVRGINLSSFLQMMELEKCTCSLRVTAKDLVGSLWVKDGDLVAAKSHVAVGKEAALDIIAWRNVFIDIDYTSYEIERQITMPLMMLIIESGRREDEVHSKIKNGRDHERYDLLAALDCDMKNMTIQCSLLDISLGGAYIETDQKVELNQNISLVLSSPLLKSTCSVDATIVRKEGRGVGIRFLMNNPEQQQMIKVMIESSMKSLQRQQQEELTPIQVV